MGMLLSPRRKIWIIICLFTSGSSTGLLSMLRSLWTSIVLVLASTIYMGKRRFIIIMMGRSSLISGRRCQIFAGSTSFQCIRCMSRLFPVVPRPVPTKSRTVVSFAAVYTDWQSGSTFISSTHVSGVGGHSTKITEIIIQTISAPVATFATSWTYNSVLRWVRRLGSRTCTWRSSRVRF